MVEHWRLIEADLHEVYGVDVDDDALMSARSWRWLRSRVLSLLDRSPSLLIHQVGQSARLVVVPSTRLGYALNPPDFSEPEAPPTH